MRLSGVYFFLILILFACREDGDEHPPQVVILSPDENASAQVGDSILVKAQIQDNEVIESVRLSLINTNSRIPIEGSKTFRPNTKSFELNHEFALSNPQMESGSYYFEIVAKDSENKESAFRSVLVNQSPRVLKGLVLATNDNGTTHIKALAINQSNASNLGTLTIPIKVAVLNNLYQQLWVVPKGDNKVQLFDLNEEKVTGSIPAPLTSMSDAFSRAQLSEDLLFLAGYNGLLNAYSPNLSDRFTYNSPNQTYVETFDVFQDRIFVVEQGNGISGSLLRSIWKVSGGVIESANLNRDVREIIALDEGIALIFSNQSGSTQLDEFFFSTGSFVSLAKITNDIVFDAIQLSKTEFILAGKHAVYRFDYRWKNINTIINGNVKAISFDESRNEFIVAHDNAVSVYSASSFQLVNAYQISNDEVMFAAFWYNR
ncbi:MAG: hypothetical protein WD530_03715 [Vicingaceae bacterium]